MFYLRGWSLGMRVYFPSANKLVMRVQKVMSLRSDYLLQLYARPLMLSQNSKFREVFKYRSTLPIMNSTIVRTINVILRFIIYVGTVFSVIIALKSFRARISSQDDDSREFTELIEFLSSLWSSFTRRWCCPPLYLFLIFLLLFLMLLAAMDSVLRAFTTEMLSSYSVNLSKKRFKSLYCCRMSIHFTFCCLKLWSSASYSLQMRNWSLRRVVSIVIVKI